MNLNASLALKLLLALGTLSSLTTSAQTLILTNGVQKYAALTGTTVNMSGKCELWATNSTTPLSGCTINLNSSDAWLVLPNIRPSVVSSSYLSQVLISGQPAAPGSNCRLEEYAMGSVLIPQSPGYTPLQVFTGPNFVGASAQFGLYTYYNTSAALGVMYRNIGSFRLKRGYMATFAQNASGTGASQVFVAQDADLDVGVLATNLDHQCSFVRVFPWHWTGKKGWVGGISSDTALVDPLWNYDYDNVATSTLDVEYVPMRDTAYWDAYANLNNKQGSTEALAFNEPDQANQANMTVAAAIAQWPSLMQSGLRLGAPAVSSSGVSGQGLDWLYSFMSQANAAGYRVDYVPVHIYKCSWTTTQFSNYLAGVYQTTGRPVWVTEFNDTDFSSGCTQTAASEASAIGGYISMMEACPFVERYSIYEYFSDSSNLRMVTTGSPQALTQAGQVYHDLQSMMAYAQTLPPGGNRSIAQFEFETNTLDSSGYGNNGFAVGAPAYVPGHTGQAVALDGANSYLRLPPNVANSASFSFAAWVYWNGGVQWQRIFDFGDDTSHYLFLTPNSGGGTLRFAINNGGGEQRLDAAQLPANTWVHVAVTLSGGNGALYTNGVLAASSSAFTISPASFNPNLNYVGKSQFSADPLFSGDLDEVQIADYAFTPTQVAALLTDTPPQFATNLISGGSATQGQPYNGSVAGMATGTGTLTYSKAGGPAWLNVAANGTLSGTPGSSDQGNNNFTVRATDAAGVSAFAVVTITLPLVLGNGTWTTDGDGIWSDVTKWASAFPANGAGNTADFSTINVTANRTVTLDSPRTIGTLKFGDTSGAQTWTVNGNDLTLDTGINGSPAIVVSQNTATLNTALDGTFGFTKSGAGTLVLGANNSLSGTLNVDTAQPSAGNDGVLKAAFPGAIDNLTAIQIRDQNSATSSLQLDGSAGSVIASAPITLNGRNNSVVAIENIAGTNTLSGGISINSGGGNYWLQSDADLLVLGGTISSVASGSRTFTFLGSGSFAISGVLGNGSATVSLVKSGSGTLTLSGANTFTGTTHVTGGTLSISGGSALPDTNAVILDNTAGVNLLLNNNESIGSLAGGGTSGGNVTLTGILTTGGDNTSTTFAGALSGPGGLTKAGTGTLTLSGVNSFAGAVSINGGGTLSVASISAALGSVSQIGMGGGGANGTLRYTGTGETSDRVIGLNGGFGTPGAVIDQSGTGLLKFTANLASGASVPHALTLQGSTSGAGELAGNIPVGSATTSIIKTGSGTWTLSGANAYAGGTTLSAGQLNLNSSTALGSAASAWTIAGASKLDNTSGGAITLINNNPQAWNADFTFTGSNPLNLGNGAVSLGASRQITVTASTLTVGGGIGGSGLGLTKQGNGTLTLSGPNTYTGSTVVNAGTLLVNGTVGPGAMTLVGGTLGGSGTITGPVTVQSGAVLAPGASPGLLTVNNSVTLSPGSITLMEISASPVTNDQLRVTGGLTYAGTLQVTNLAGNLTAGDTFTLFFAGSFNGGFNTVNLPPLGPGLAWVTTGLTNGVLSVVATVLPQISSIVQSPDGNFMVGGTGAAYANYELDAVTNLLPPRAWLYVTNGAADSGGAFQLFDSQATNFSQRFYRVISSP